MTEIVKSTSSRDTGNHSYVPPGEKDRTTYSSFDRQDVYEWLLAEARWWAKNPWGDHTHYVERPGWLHAPDGASNA